MSTVVAPPVPEVAPAQTFAEYARQENAREAAGESPEPTPEPEPTAPPAPTAPPVEPESEPEPAPDDERDPVTGQFKAKPKDEGDPRKSIQAKISYERKLRAQAERERDEARAALATRTQPADTKSDVAAIEAPKVKPYLALVKQYEADPDYPQLQDFVDAGFVDPYQACAAAQGAFLNEKQAEAREQAAVRTKVQQELTEKHTAAMESGREKYPDWDALLESDAAQVKISKEVTAEIYQDPDLSTDLIHHLLTHPDELARVAVMTDPVAAARAIAKMTASLALTAAPAGPAEKPSVTKAKPLIKPVKASPVAPEAPSVDAMPFGKEYIRRLNAIERKREEDSRGA